MAALGIPSEELISLLGGMRVLPPSGYSRRPAAQLHAMSSDVRTLEALEAQLDSQREALSS